MPDGVHEVPVHPVQSPAAAAGDFGDGELGFDVVCHNHAPPCDEVDDEPALGEHAPMTVVAVRAAEREAIFRFPSMSVCLLRSFLVSARTGRRPRDGTESCWRVASIISTYSLRWQMRFTGPRTS
jgi:hypothetical protein